MIVLRRLRAAYVRDGDLIGSRNGVNKTFQTEEAYRSGSVIVDYNGQSLYSPDDFVEVGNNQITFVYIVPHNDDVLKVSFERY